MHKIDITQKTDNCSLICAKFLSLRLLIVCESFDNGSDPQFELDRIIETKKSSVKNNQPTLKQIPLFEVALQQTENNISSGYTKYVSFVP